MGDVTPVYCERGWGHLMALIDCQGRERWWVVLAPKQGQGG